MIDRLQEIVNKQKVLAKKIAQESAEDIHSVLRTKMLVDSYIELEVKRTLLIDLIVKKS